MRVLLVIPTIASYLSFLQDISIAMVRDGHDVHIACSTDTLWGVSSKINNCGIQVHPLPFPRGVNLLEHYKSSRKLNFLVSSIKPDIVHSHFSSSIFTTAMARKRSWPIAIGTFQGMSYPIIPGIKGFLLKIAETQSAKNLDAVWVLTDDDLSELRHAVPKAKIYKQQALGFGCNLTRFNQAAYSDESRKLLRTQLGISLDNHVFAFIGRFVDFKGYGLTVRAFLNLAKNNPNVTLLTIGAQDGLHPTGLSKEDHSALKNSTQIIDLRWQKDVERYLSITDTVVLPSNREGIPVSLMEALAMGIPVITCNSRGCRDIVRDNIDGIVMESSSTENLVEAMARIAYNPIFHRTLATNALMDRKRFSRQNYIDEQIMIYKRLGSLQYKSSSLPV